MESAKLRFRQIKLTALSPRSYSKARNPAHYQMRKAISKETNNERRNADAAWRIKALKIWLKI